MLESEVKERILHILYDESMTDSSRNFSSEDFVTMIPQSSKKQIERVLNDLHNSGFFEFAVFFEGGGGLVQGLTSKAVAFYEDHYLTENLSPTSVNHKHECSMNRSIFIVHGHDDEMKVKVAYLISKLGLNPIILNEQANGGKTIIEKFEEHSQKVNYAIVLMSNKDDLGRSIQEEKLKPRARQNVILELGYFIGQLGRNRVCVLKMEDVEAPSDILGIVYTAYSNKSNDWQHAVAKELSAAGFDVDYNMI